MILIHRLEVIYSELEAIEKFTFIGWTSLAIVMTYVYLTYGLI